MVFAEDGTVAFQEPPGKIGPATSYDALVNGPLGTGLSVKMRQTTTRIELPPATIGGEKFNAAVIFEAQKLHHLELYMPQSGDGKSWADWDQKKERARKETAEAWVNKVTGKEMAVKPLDLEDGTSVTPFEVTWETARHVPFPWGEIVSYFDSKSGMAELAVRYQEKANG